MITEQVPEKHVNVEVACCNHVCDAEGLVDVSVQQALAFSPDLVDGACGASLRTL